MIDYTEQLNTNIQNMKNIPGVDVVRVTEAPDYIVQQVGEPCLCFEIFGNSKVTELYVPTDFCTAVVAPFDDVMCDQIMVPLQPDYHNTYSFFKVVKRFIDLDEVNFNHLDGGVIVDELTEEQDALVDMISSVEGITSVTIKTIVDPELLPLVDCEEGIIVQCSTVKEGKMLKFLLPKIIHSDIEQFDTLKLDVEHRLNIL